MALTFNLTFKTHHKTPLSSSSSSPSRLVPKPDLSQIGFFFCSRDFWLHVLEQIVKGDLKCPLKSDFIKLIVTFDKFHTSNFYFSKISLTNPNLLTHLFGNCIPDLEISINVRSEMHNIDSRSNRRDYLSIGKNKERLRRGGVSSGALSLSLSNHLTLILSFICPTTPPISWVYTSRCGKSTQLIVLRSHE
ncbi:unnamed protein product [Camellia sinensis]